MTVNLTTLLAWVAGILALLAARIAAILLLPTARRKLTQPPPGGLIRTLVVLGSGGHTAEMLQLTKGMDRKRYAPWYYVLADSDTTSLGKLAAAAGGGGGGGEGGGGGGKGAPPKPPPEGTVFRIPRSREVGQGWLSTVLSTARATAWALALTARLRPHLVVANGPGTCLPICVAAFALRVLGVADTRVVFCESWCRVKTLSLTGKLLYPIADRFVVQWPELTAKYKRAEYLGVLC
jgi:beta-1,4-N-acetylglucosaminyltransferase